MYDDPDRIAGIQVYACLTCGNRVYVGYPKRRGGETEKKRSIEDNAGSVPARNDSRVLPFRRAPKSGTAPG